MSDTETKLEGYVIRLIGSDAMLAEEATVQYPRLTNDYRDAAWFRTAEAADMGRKVYFSREEAEIVWVHDDIAERVKPDGTRIVDSDPKPPAVVRKIEAVKIDHPFDMHTQKHRYETWYLAARIMPVEFSLLEGCLATSDWEAADFCLGVIDQKLATLKAELEEARNEVDW